MTKASLQKQKNIANNEQGQSLVEFVLLLSLIMILSLGFLKTVNTGIANYWLSMGQMLVEDPSQNLTLR